jgi:hypothetical protein
MAGRICRFNDVELWQRDRKVAVFHHKAKPPIVNDWPTVATGRNWSGGLEQARRMAAGPVDPLTNERLQNLVRAKRGFANEEHGESVGKPKLISLLGESEQRLALLAARNRLPTYPLACGASLARRCGGTLVRPCPR